MAAALITVCGILFYLRTVYYAEQSMLASSMPPGTAPKLNFNSAILASLPATVSFVMIFFVIPATTMHVFAEEKKNGTLEMLFTYPFTEFDLIAGKYIGSILAILPGAALTALFPIFLLKYMPGMDLGYLAAGYTGIILACLAGTAIGIWASSLTSSQILACSITILTFLILWLIGGSADLMDGIGREFLNAVSFSSNLETFTKGTIELPAVVYFIGLTLFFLYLTYYNLTSRKWRG